MKKKILVFSPDIRTTSIFFVQTKIFQDIMDAYDIYVCCNIGTKGSNLSLLQNKGFKNLYAYECSTKRKRIDSFQLFINTLGGRKYSRSCGIIYNMMGKAYGNIIERFIHRLLGFSEYSARIVSYIFEKYIGEDQTIKNIINTVKPDLIITFLIGSNPLEIESIKTGRLNKIPVMGIQSGWEHISTRGLMPYLPDYMGVWGYQSRIFAERMHMMLPERVFHIGTPFADKFRAPQNKSSVEIRRKLGLPENRKVIFFVGNMFGYNEICNLSLLDRAIEKGKLGNSCVFYRPHPLRKVCTFNFFGNNFKHVYLDPASVKQHKSKKQDNRNFQSNKHNISIDIEHMKEILAVSSIIIAYNSTVLIQGAICGVPSVNIVYTDKANKKFRKIYETEHMSIVKSMSGVFPCHKSDALIETCLKAFRFSESKSKIKIMMQHAALVIHDDELGFAKRLKNAIDAILNPQESSVFHFLNEPVLTMRKKSVVHDADKYSDE